MVGVDYMEHLETDYVSVLNLETVFVITCQLEVKPLLKMKNNF